jgi:hypothetical protein
VFIVIDGLDEIIDPSPILEILTGVELATTNLKLFVASRPDTDLELAFQDYLTVAITASDVQDDMEAYVMRNFEKLKIGDDDVDRQAICA